MTLLFLLKEIWLWDGWSIRNEIIKSEGRNNIEGGKVEKGREKKKKMEGQIVMMREERRGEERVVGSKTGQKGKEDLQPTLKIILQIFKKKKKSVLSNIFFLQNEASIMILHSWRKIMKTVVKVIYAYTIENENNVL